MTQETFVCLDDEEKQIMEAYEAGEYVLAPNQEQLKAELQAVAKRHAPKNMHINLRFSPTLVEGIKKRALQEGIPYQTLISSLVYKYMTGQLVDISTLQQAVSLGYILPPPATQMPYPTPL